MQHWKRVMSIENHTASAIASLSMINPPANPAPATSASLTGLSPSAKLQLVAKGNDAAVTRSSCHHCFFRKASAPSTFEGVASSRSLAWPVSAAPGSSLNRSCLTLASLARSHSRDASQNLFDVVQNQPSHCLNRRLRSTFCCTSRAIFSSSWNKVTATSEVRSKASLTRSC